MIDRTTACATAVNAVDNPHVWYAAVAAVALSLMCLGFGAL